MSWDPTQVHASPGQAGGTRGADIWGTFAEATRPSHLGLTEQRPQDRSTRTPPPGGSQDPASPPAHWAGEPGPSLPASSRVGATEKNQVAVLHKEFWGEGVMCLLHIFCCCPKSAAASRVPRSRGEASPGRRRRPDRGLAPRSAPCVHRAGWPLSAGVSFPFAPGLIVSRCRLTVADAQRGCGRGN